MPAAAREVRDSVAAALRPVVDRALEVECVRLPVRTGTVSKPIDHCSVGYRRDTRAAFVFVDPLLARDDGHVVGSVVGVYDGSF